MLPSLRKIGLAAAMAGVIAVGTVTLPDAAHARWGGWGGGWHGGGWRGGGWGWGGFGVGVGTGLLLGAATAPYWGGYGYGPYYGGGPSLCSVWRTLRRRLLHHTPMGLEWLWSASLETRASLLLTIRHNE